MFDEFKDCLEVVFGLVRRANLKPKPTKVKLFQRKISFLGHRISQGGVTMDPEKVAEIVSWKTPVDVHEVREFMGLCGYYRWYIEDFVIWAAAL